MIEVQDVHVTFGRGTPLENRALRGLDLTIPTGEFVTVIGSNGAGKSTLLNVLSGDAAAERGRVEIDGVDVTRWPAPKRAGLVARVFQDPMAGTCEALSIEENMALAHARGRAPRPRRLARRAAPRGVPRQAGGAGARAGEPAGRFAWACSPAASARRSAC